MAKKNQSNAKNTTNKTAPASTPTRATGAETIKQSAAQSSPNWYIYAVLAITFLVFLSSLGNQFVNWDDEVNLLENANTEVLDWAHIKRIFTDRVIGNYNPLPILTLTIERHFVGLNPQLYHVNNLILHLICTFLVYRLMRVLDFRVLTAALVALFFGIHPMRVESVAWVTERKDVLFGVFYLAALIYYILSQTKPEKKGIYTLFTLGLFVLALFSKIQAVSLPLTMLAIDYYRKRDFNVKLIMEKVPYFALSLLFGLMGIYFLAENKSLAVEGVDNAHLNFIQRLLVGAYSYVVYLIKWITPYEMSPLYPYPGSLDAKFYVAPLLVAGVAYLTYNLWKKEQRTLVFGILFFTVNVMFLLQILGAGQGFIADRFTYIPYIGLFIVFAHLYETYSEKWSSLGIVTALYLGILAFVAFRQVGIWKDGGALWTHVLKYYPDAVTPWNNRGSFYREKKQMDKAMADYSSSLALKPQASTYNSRGKAYFDTNQTEKAIADYTSGIALDSTIAELFANRGSAYGKFSDEKKQPQFLQNALQDLRKAVAIDPKGDNTYINLYLVNMQLSNYPDALAALNRYIEKHDKEWDLYYEKGLILRLMNKYDEALPMFSLAIQNTPQSDKNYPLFLLERSMAYEKLGNKPESVKDAQLAKKLGHPNVPANLLQ